MTAQPPPFDPDESLILDSTEGWWVAPAVFYGSAAVLIVALVVLMVVYR